MQCLTAQRFRNIHHSPFTIHHGINEHPTCELVSDAKPPLFLTFIFHKNQMERNHEKHIPGTPFDSGRTLGELRDRRYYLHSIHIMQLDDDHEVGLRNTFRSCDHTHYYFFRCCYRSPLESSARDVWRVKMNSYLCVKFLDAVQNFNDANGSKAGRLWMQSLTRMITFFLSIP